MSVTLLTQIRELPDNIFNGCSSLRYISIRFFDAFNNGNLDLSQFAITRIGNNAFNGVMSLGQIIFPQQSLTLGSSTFSNCPNLHTVQFKQLEGFNFNLNNPPFQNDNALYTVQIPDNTKCSSVTLINFNSLFSGSSLASKDWFTLCDANTESTENSSSSSSKGISGGVIAVIIIVILIVVGGLAVGGFFLWKKRQIDHGVNLDTENKPLFSDLIDK